MCSAPVRQAQVRQGASPGRFPDLGLLSSSASSWCIGNDGKAKATSGPQHQAEDQGGEDPDGLVELEDSTTMDGTTFTTPFAEKPVDGGEDHNVWIYYPITAGGGGVKKVLREKGSKSSDLYPDHPGQRQEDASFLYDERFMQTGQKRTRRSFLLAKNWQYKTVFSIRLALGHVVDRIDPKPVMHLKPFSLSLSLCFGPSSLSPTQKAFQRILHFIRNRKKITHADLQARRREATRAQKRGERSTTKTGDGAESRTWS